MSEHSKAFSFYAGRIAAVPNYGLVAGDEILNKIQICAQMDSALSYEEYREIMDLIDRCHRKLMEVNFNEGWN